MFLFTACNKVKHGFPIEENNWNKYIGLNEYWKHVESMLPFYQSINEQVKRTVDPDKLPHAVRLGRLKYALSKSLSNMEIHAIQAEVEVDSVGVVRIDTFSLFYSVEVQADTSYGILFVTGRGNPILEIACKVYKDSMARNVEKAIIKKDDSGEVMKTVGVEIDDSVVFAKWLFENDEKGIEFSVQDTININSKDIPRVYEEISEFLESNKFFYFDSTSVPPVELLDEFLKEVYNGEKGTNYGQTFYDGFISSLFVGFITLEFPSSAILQILTGAG